MGVSACFHWEGKEPQASYISQTVYLLLLSSNQLQPKEANMKRSKNLTASAME